jgi:hypothetical protein
MSEQERIRVLRVLDAHLGRVPQRDHAGVDRELKELRASRRTGWRRR